MKKLLLVLLVVALASFLFVGCLPTAPAEGEGEGEGEGEAALTVAIGDSVVLDGKTYVSDGAHSITVTFAEAVVGNVEVNVSGCTGDYKVAGDVVMFPDADKKVWTGSATFGSDSEACCASYVEVSVGDCGAECVTKFPVIVDSSHPTATIDVSIDTCSCDGCEFSFESAETDPECADPADLCGDDCSGLVNWSISVYDEDPFDTCCLTPCVEPIGICSGTDCPIECVTACLENTTELFVVVTLIDQVGNESKAFAKIAHDDGDTCEEITVTQWAANDLGCTDWDVPADTSEAIIIQ